MKELNKVSIAKLSELRKDRNWSQSHLSEISGLSVRTIQRIEKGANPDYESIMALSAVFELDFQKEIEDQNVQSNLKMNVFYSLSAFAISLTILGMLFKVLHWKGANMMLLVGVAVLALVIVPLLIRMLFIHKGSLSKL
ncbi:helix-turn-helix domain-containing protein [bacterium]|nr:helix-turn-helix domain-containing protein [bacterium]